MGKLIGIILSYLLPTLLDWCKKQFDSYQAKKKAREEIRNENRLNREQTEAAQTPKEREDAASKVISDF